ncbi:MAG TPA: hypothetical protein VGR57_16750, partial [Ktedonobacterales bacterium]|nr:hypothetical protein [Ktedonobacterales bacterium]
MLTITGPRSKGARIVVEAKRKINPIDVPLVVSQLRKSAQPGEAMLAIAPYLGPRARALLAAERVGYADATGNLYLTLDQPVIYIERTGASTNPWK